jgi:hypothetical protein
MTRALSCGERDGPLRRVTRSAHDPPTAEVYRLRLTSSRRISSDVVMTRELAWKPR